MLTLLLLACSPREEALPSPADTATVQIPDRYHLGDGFIRDPQGRARVLRGVNDSNAAKDPNTGFLGWTGADDMRALVDMGFDSVRLLTFWEAIEPEEGVIDTDYLDALEARVRAATGAGLLVILDMHQDVYGRGFGHDGAPGWTCDQALYDSFEPPEGSWALSYLTPEVRECFDRLWASDDLHQHYADAWAAVAERVADNPSVIGFDLMNEPWPASDDTNFGADTLQPFYADLAARLGEVAPGKLVFVEPITMVQYGELDPGLSAMDGVVFAPHYYLPTVHEGEPYDGDTTPIDTAFTAYDGYAADMGTTWWLGEWGGPQGDGGIASYLADVDARTLDRAVGTALWSYDQGGGFSILDADGVLREDIAQALQHPRVVAYGGDPGGASWDGQTLRFTVRARPGVDAPSLVWVGDCAAGTTVEGAEESSCEDGVLSVVGVGELVVGISR